MKLKIFRYKKVKSTNDTAINLIKSKKKKEGCVYAETQSKGRGTRGKKWVSKKGNLHSTIFFQLKDNYPPFNEFSIINPVIVSDVVKNFCLEKKISIKWPNDIFLNGKKICGILQELITFNDKKFLVVGIGLNILSSPKIITKYESTNIYFETKKKPSLNEIIKILINKYENFLLNINLYKYSSFKKKAKLI